jgi:hypothetical protein
MILKYKRDDHVYASDDGYVMQREYGKTPNGNNLDGRWVFSDPSGQLIDFDQYRNDLAERNNFQLAVKEEK